MDIFYICNECLLVCDIILEIKESLCIRHDDAINRKCMHMVLSKFIIFAYVKEYITIWNNL